VSKPLHEEPVSLQEEECIRRAQAGDVEALGQLYDTYAARLYRNVIYPALGDASQAEDVLSETFRSAFAKLSEFHSRGVSIYSWLARIARNKALDVHRRQKARGRALQNFAELLVPALERSVSPEQQLTQEVSRLAVSARVQHTLAQLNARYRLALELRFFQELPRAACAEQLGVKLGTFDVLLLRALRAFRKSWTSSCEEPLEAQGE